LTTTRRRWEIQVAGLPCIIERDRSERWVVTIAATTVAQGRDLADAIYTAAAGLVSRHESRTAAAQVWRMYLQTRRPRSTSQS